MVYSQPSPSFTSMRTLITITTTAIILFFTSRVDIASAAFACKECSFVTNPSRSLLRLSMVYAPPGSGYFTPEDEESPLPPGYDPIMEYPGTMRPARTRENVPYEDLPIDEDGPPPVPWPHFQEIPYHHVWGSPHDEAPLSINQYIDDMGRWATLEEEAETIRQTRRAMRDAKAAAQQQAKEDMVIMDDDLEDDDDEDQDSFDTSKVISRQVPSKKAEAELEEDGDFLLEELGLDLDEGYEASVSSTTSKPEKVQSKSAAKPRPEPSVVDEDDFDFDLGLDDDNDGGDELVDDLGDDVTLDEDGVSVEGTDHRGKIDPIVPDDYEKSNNNMDDFDGYNDELDIYSDDDDDYGFDDDDLDFDDDDEDE